MHPPGPRRSADRSFRGNDLDIIVGMFKHRYVLYERLEWIGTGEGGCWGLHRIISICKIHEQAQTIQLKRNRGLQVYIWLVQLEKSKSPTTEGSIIVECE